MKNVNALSAFIGGENLRTRQAEELKRLIDDYKEG